MQELKKQLRQFVGRSLSVIHDNPDLEEVHVEAEADSLTAQLLALFTQSVEEGYQRGLKDAYRMIDITLTGKEHV